MDTSGVSLRLRALRDSGCEQVVLIGNSGGDVGARGYMTAYNADTGEKAWRFFIVPGEPGKPDGEASDSVMEMAAKTWTGEWWKMGGGGAVWDGMAYDPDLDIMYIGVGNGNPWNQRLRDPVAGGHAATFQTRRSTP